jgi:hypothetical protein
MKAWSVCALLLAATSARAAGYDPKAAFAPLPMAEAVNVYRAGSGRPGPSYWQNRADYQIHATLDTKAHALAGDVAIGYTNNSPDALDVLWLQLDQNMYRADSRAKAATEPAHLRFMAGSTDGYTIESVEVEQAGRRTLVTPIISDTRMQVPLPTPLEGKGGKLTLHVRYRFTIPAVSFGGRMAWGKVKDGETYDLAQWYPRMAVYDDIRGWDPLPYLGQEFYLEYGDFDYWVTVPATMTVAGSGALENPAEVLTDLQLARLTKATESDRTVAIIAPSEIAAAHKGSGTKTWHFHMANTRDVAFSASDAFAWDAARIRLPAGRTALAMSYYPAESAGDARWGRSTEYVKDTVETMSRRWYPYPWPAAINIAGPATGMEYPGIVFDGVKDAGKELFWITAHEIGHDWFPMMVGFDERRHAWMDEGFNTFIDTFESEDFNKGEYAPKRDSEFAPGGGNPVDEILPILADPTAPLILSRADTVIEKWRHPVTYFKSALGLVLLRDQILGPDRFDPAFRRFIATWAYKHPKPSDFFRFMDSETGEDLSWWWRGWYVTNATYDVAITQIVKDAGGGSHVMVENKDPMVMPVTLRLSFADGSHEDRRLPAETWIRQAVSSIVVPAGKTLVSAELDPDHTLPDHDRSNNRMSAN